MIYCTVIQTRTSFKTVAGVRAAACTVLAPIGGKFPASVGIIVTAIGRVFAAAGMAFTAAGTTGAVVIGAVVIGAVVAVVVGVDDEAKREANDFAGRPGGAAVCVDAVSVDLSL